MGDLTPWPPELIASPGDDCGAQVVTQCHVRVGDDDEAAEGIHRDLLGHAARARALASAITAVESFIALGTHALGDEVPPRVWPRQPR